MSSLSIGVITDPIPSLKSIHIGKKGDGGDVLGLVLLTQSKDKNWDSHSPMNGYPSFYPRIALVATSPG